MEFSKSRAKIRQENKNNVNSIKRQTNSPILGHLQFPPYKFKELFRILTLLPSGGFIGSAQVLLAVAAVATAIRNRFVFIRNIAKTHFILHLMLLKNVPEQFCS